MRFLFMLVLLALSSEAYSMQKAACNMPGKKNNSIISIKPNMEYCFSGFASNRFFNLTNNVVMAASEFGKVYELNPYESSIITNGKIHILSYGDGAVISSRKSIILTPYKTDKKKAMALYKENLAGGYIVRSSQKFLPAILVPAIIGGATGIAGSIGDSIMDGEEICVSDVIVTAVSGVITGAAVPIMTPGIIGGIAATGLGVSAKGMCTSCHLGSYCGGGKH